MRQVDTQLSSLNWGAICAVLFSCAAWFLFARGFSVGFTGWIWFGALSLGMAVLATIGFLRVSPFQSLFLFFSPTALCLLIFTFYFYLVLSVNNDATEFCVTYIACTSALTMIFVVSLWPLIKAVRYRSIRRYRVSAGARLLIGTSLLGWTLLVLAGILGGIGSLLDIYRDPLRMRTFMSGGGMAYYKIVCDFLVLMPPNIAALRRYSEGKPSRVFPLLVLSGILYTLASGSRGTTIGLLLSLIMIRQFLGKPLKPILFVAFGVAIVPFVAILGEYRSNPLLYGEGIGSILKIGSALGPENILKLFVARLDASYYFNLLTQQRSSTPLLYGVSYLAWPLQVIPRFLWPGKPLLPNTELTYRLVTDSANNVTFDFSIFGESYLNFGVMGVLFSALVIFVFIAYLQRRYEKMVESRDVSEVLFFILMWGMSMYVVVSGVVAMATATSLVLVQYWVARMLFLQKVGSNG